jgi:hypothetical protein
MEAMVEPKVLKPEAPGGMFASCTNAYLREALKKTSCIVVCHIV